MTAGPAVHDLLRLGPEVAGRLAGTAPGWVAAALGRAPWVVVRRARAAAPGAVAVGVRGDSRSERWASELPLKAVAELLRPEGLLPRAALLPVRRTARIPALAVLPQVEQIMSAAGLGWGPGGSVGFELAVGVPTARPSSDLDLVVRAPAPLGGPAAAALAAGLARLPVRVDAQLETPQGAVALAEYAAGRGAVLLRTPDGPVLSEDPWRLYAAARR
jgi:phosphoribosyl-dephospho-CoA transferase